MHLPKPLRHPFIVIARVIDDDGQQEGEVRIHEVAAINRQLPFEAEVALTAIVRGVRDDREEQRAGLDLLADRLVPRIPAPKLALVEPDFDASGAQRLANPLGRLRVLRGVAEKYSTRRLRHGHLTPRSYSLSCTLGRSLKASPTPVRSNVTACSDAAVKSLPTF